MVAGGESDISAALADEACRRLPHWRDRIWAGNALDWRPPGDRRFDFVHTLLDTVREQRLKDMIDHQLQSLVAPGGRLIVRNYIRFEDGSWHAGAVLTRLGFRVDGVTSPGGPRRDGRFTAPAAWMDVPR